MRIAEKEGYHINTGPDGAFPLRGPLPCGPIPLSLGIWGTLDPQSGGVGPSERSERRPHTPSPT